MKLKAIFISLISLCAVSVAGAQTIEDAVAKFTEAQELLKTKQFGKAIPVLEEALSMAGDLEGDGAMALSEDIKKMIPQVYMYDGVSMVQAKQFQAGIDQLIKAEELATKYGNRDVRRQAARMASTAYMAMGIESFNNKDFPAALEIFKKGYTQDSTNVQVALFTAKAYAETQAIDNALALFGQVIEAGAANSKFAPQAAEAKSDITNYVLFAASEAAKANDYDKVESYISKVMAVDPANEQAPIILIQLANNLKKYDAVIEYGTKAVELQTTPEGKSTVNLLLGVAYQNKGNNAKAIELLKKVTAGPSVAQAQALVKELSAAQ